MTTQTSATSTDPEIAASAVSGASSRTANRRVRGGRGVRGFTMLEITVVVAIIGVVSALVLPSIRAGYRQAAVRRSVRSFISAARQASALAVKSRRPAALVIWPDDNSFGVEGSRGRYQLPDFAEFGDIVGGSEVEGDDEIRFQFFPMGSSSGGSVAIEFTPGDRRQAYVLVLDPLIGRVRIEEDS